MGFLLFLLIFTYFNVNIWNFLSTAFKSKLSYKKKNCNGQTTKATTKIFNQKQLETQSYIAFNLDFSQGT